ncbi:MAG: hypothetical protein OQJ93_10315, partial [Ignavibacteriaceae bacterium]|nr:hypothetical protein [Ignavibacteriaceae bacterium]
FEPIEGFVRKSDRNLLKSGRFLPPECITINTSKKFFLRRLISTEANSIRLWRAGWEDSKGGVKPALIY